MKAFRRAALLALLLLILGGAAYVTKMRRGPSRQPIFAALSAPTVVRAPDSVRIRVQVLNSTRIRGLARRATRLLRDRGFDVVEIGTTGPAIDTTLVLDRSRHSEWAAAVAAVMSPARAVSRPDSSRYLDVTVLIGRTWRPPAEPLDP
jgi:hypothetical protein